MILNRRFAPRLSPRGKALFCLLALVALPLFLQSAKSHAQQNSDLARQAIEEASSKPIPRGDLKSSALRATFEAKFPRVPEHPSDADFPQIVHFEQGASNLLDGDKIDITEIRGTAATMTSGNQYWIKGTYTLASHDRASLMVGVTAAIASEGTGSTLKTQSVEVTKGSGNFTLLYAMICKGWPHVSFYPAGGGGDLGGTYFGTGEFVLRKWWGEGKSETHNAHADAAPSNASATDFPHVVHFGVGETQFLPGDSITISEVRGTAEKIALGEIYCIKGHYTLASHDQAQMNVGISAQDVADARRSGFKPQDSIVHKGKGTFTLFLPMGCKGWPHISLYPAEGGNDFGGVYFGTGDSVHEPSVSKSSADEPGLEGLPPKLLPGPDNGERRIWEKLGLRCSALRTPRIAKMRYEGGVLITEVRPDSPASRLGLHKGDCVLGIDPYATVTPANVLWILNHRLIENPNQVKLLFIILRPADDAVQYVDATVAFR